MALHDPNLNSARNLLYADVTQSWSDVGGGVRTYLNHKRRHILENTPHRHLLIIPGKRDSAEVEESGRAITVSIASPKVPGSPHYRLLLRNGAVRQALAQHLPDLIECQDAYNLPWAAIGHARRHPGTALVAAYCTDFPTVYADRPFLPMAGTAGRKCGGPHLLCLLREALPPVRCRLCDEREWRRHKAKGPWRSGDRCRTIGCRTRQFSPQKRDPRLRRRLGLTDDQPLLIYAGRLDLEKRPHIVVEAFGRLPRSLGAALLLLGDGPLREQFAGREQERIFAPGYCSDRSDLAAWLASADLYVSAMADETFGISIVEAQASGLPVVGVAAGAMVDRVPSGLGLVGEVDDAGVMATNIVSVLKGDMAAMRERARDHALSSAGTKA